MVNDGIVNRYKQRIIKLMSEATGLNDKLIAAEEKIRNLELQVQHSALGKEELLKEIDKNHKTIEALRLELKEALEKQVVRLESKIETPVEEEKPKPSRRRRSTKSEDESSEPETSDVEPEVTE